MPISARICLLSFALDTSVSFQASRLFGSRSLARSFTAGSFTASASHSTSVASSSMAPNSTKPAFVDVYPYDTPDEAMSKYKSIKTVHFVRHAEGTHNVKKDYSSIEHVDARLTEKGKLQCRSLAKRIAKSDLGTTHHDLYTKADLLVTSPLTRCIQTCIRSCKSLIEARPSIPIIAMESIRETVNFHCDRRRPVAALSTDFPIVEYDMVPNHDTAWDAYHSQLGPPEAFTTFRESAQIYKVAERGRHFFGWLASRSERHVVICSHCAFYRCLWNYGQEGEAKGIATDVEQGLDDRLDSEDHPVVRIQGDDDFVRHMRTDYQNCELRSVRIGFP